MEDDDRSPAASNEDDDLFGDLLQRLGAISVSDKQSYVKQVASILGIDEASAEFFLMASNGNLETAINLYLDAMKQDGGRSRRAPAATAFGSAYGSGGAAAPAPAAASSFGAVYEEEDPVLAAAIAASLGQAVPQALASAAASTQEYTVLPDGRAVVGGMPAAGAGAAAPSSSSAAPMAGGPAYGGFGGFGAAPPAGPGTFSFNFGAPAPGPGPAGSGDQMGDV